MFSMLVGRPGAESKLAGIRLNQEASLYELEGVQKNGMAANVAEVLRQ